jgi:hypothetical protein
MKHTCVMKHPCTLLPECHIKGSTSPDLKGAGIGQDVGCGRCSLEHINGTHTSGQQGLVGITPACKQQVGR